MKFQERAVCVQNQYAMWKTNARNLLGAGFWWN